MTSKAAKAKGAERKQRMDTSSLMEQILSKDNLNAAYLQVVRNKGAAGVDGMTVEGSAHTFRKTAKASGNSCGQGSINRSLSEG